MNLKMEFLIFGIKKEAAFNIVLIFFLTIFLKNANVSFICIT